MKQKTALKWLFCLFATIIFFVVFLFIHKYKFYTPASRILVFEQNGKPILVKDNKWITLLENKFKKNHLNTSIFHNKCTEFWLSDKDKNTIWIEHHQYHQDGCPGDPNSSPRINTFVINKTTKAVFWYDVVRDKVVDFEEYINQ